MKITILVEGNTEKAFMPYLRAFLARSLAGKMPRLDPYPCDGRIPKEAKLQRVVKNLLAYGKPPSDAVIALCDVYTGTDDFKNAADAKTKMRQWVGQEKRFYPHTAQHDFEAWLLPYWSEIQKLAGHNRNAPAGPPETVDHNKPPAEHLREIFRAGKCRDDYSKPRDARRILQGQDLSVSAAKCPELKSFLNTILGLCGGELLE